MKKDVSIRLLSRQNDGSDTEETELLSLGTLEMTEGGYIISYEETEATGFEGSTTSLEFFDSNKVVMNRRGNVVSNLVSTGSLSCAQQIRYRFQSICIVCEPPG